MTLRSKFVIPALLVTTAALSGCDDLPQEINPMEYAIQGLCKANAYQDQKIDCLEVTDGQAQFTAKMMERQGVTLPKDVKEDCYGFIRPDDEIPDSVDVLTQLNASRVKACFNGLENAAPADMKPEIKRIAGYNYKGLEISGL